MRVAMNTFRMSCFAALLLVLAPVACEGGTEASCRDLCTEGQERDCTSIEGDCGDFCAALFGVEEQAGCVEEREEYQSCLEEEDVCLDCGIPETELEQCLIPYCTANAGNADCQVLATSF
jgi:hypothetical protein